MRKASLKTTIRWNELPWAKIQRKTFKLQKRIFQAAKLRHKAKARKLQKLLLKLYYAKLLAVRRVTQDNQGKKTFSSEDHHLWNMLRAWIVSRIGKVNHQKISKYFSRGRHGKWTFQTREDKGYVLMKHSEIPIVRHTLVKPEASPYDGNWVDWSKRRGNYPETPSRVVKLMKKQKGKCNFYKQHFSPEDVVEVDHIIPKSKGGKDEWKNLQLLHRHCHDVKTRHDGSNEKSVDNTMEIPENYRWIDDVLVVPV